MASKVLKEIKVILGNEASKVNKANVVSKDSKESKEKKEKLENKVFKDPKETMDMLL